MTILQKIARNFRQPSDRWSNRQLGSHGEGDNSEGGFEPERHLSKFRGTNPGSHEKGGVRMFRMANLILIRWLKGDFKSPHHVEAISSLLPFKYQLRSKKPGGGKVRWFFSWLEHPGTVFCGADVRLKKTGSGKKPPPLKSEFFATKQQQQKQTRFFWQKVPFCCSSTNFFCFL